MSSNRPTPVGTPIAWLRDQRGDAEGPATLEPLVLLGPPSMASKATYTALCPLSHLLEAQALMRELGLALRSAHPDEWGILVARTSHRLIQAAGPASVQAVSSP